jgi:hypothetical protein
VTARPPIRVVDFTDCRVRKIRTLRWQWTIRDGMTGPVLAEGVSLTERAAYRHMDAVTGHAEHVRPVVPAGDQPLRPLGEWTAAAINGDLAEAQVPVAIAVGPDGAIDLYALDELSTTQEVQALFAVAAETDARLRWHGHDGVTAG